MIDVENTREVMRCLSDDELARFIEAMGVVAKTSDHMKKRTGYEIRITIIADDLGRGAESEVQGRA